MSLKEKFFNNYRLLFAVVFIFIGIYSLQDGSMISGIAFIVIGLFYSVLHFVSKRQ